MTLIAKLNDDAPRRVSVRALLIATAGVVALSAAPAGAERAPTTPPALTDVDAVAVDGVRLASVSAPNGGALSNDLDEAEIKRALNAAAPQTPGASPAGLAHDPELRARAAAVAAVYGPTARPSGSALTMRAAFEGADADLSAFYFARAYRPIWIGRNGAAGRARGLIEALKATADHGLPSERYTVSELEAALDAFEAGPRDAAAAAELERRLAETYLTAARDLSRGMLRPRDVSRRIDVSRPEAPTETLLTAAAETTSMSSLLTELAPQTRDYAELKAVFAALGGEASAGGWGAPVTARRSLRPFDRGDAVDALRARLIALGDLPASTPRATHPETGDTLFDTAVEQAVRAFQARHGLAIDGVAGANTLAALNVDAAERRAQIAVNLERARWRNMNRGDRHIQVNIPDYHVDVLDDGASIYRSRVVVGKRRHQTPEFSDEMTHVIINPYWHVPYSIATEEFLPQLRDAPGALARRNIHVYTQGGRRVDPWSVDWWNLDRGYFPYRLRQGPGRSNALGDVKFIFPNHHAVYLHDTPSKKLFAKPQRAFSHGCIRVAKPRLLAETLMAAQMDDAVREYDRLTSASGERPVKMDEKVDVHLLYRTAWVDQTGVLQLRGDLYGRDALMAAELRKAGLSI